MENTKDDKKVTPKDRPASRSRTKVKTAKQFCDSTKQVLFNNYSHEEQNGIVKELYFAVRESRSVEIDKCKAKAERLFKLNEDLPVGE